MSKRILRIQEVNGLDMEDAYRLATREDRRSAGYLEEVFDIDWDDPTLYHLIINAGKMSVEQAAQIIVHTVGQMTTEPQPELLTT